MDFRNCIFSLAKRPVMSMLLTVGDKNQAWSKNSSWHVCSCNIAYDTDCMMHPHPPPIWPSNVKSTVHSNTLDYSQCHAQYQWYQGSTIPHCPKYCPTSPFQPTQLPPHWHWSQSHSQTNGQHINNRKRTEGLKISCHLQTEGEYQPEAQTTMTTNSTMAATTRGIGKALQQWGTLL